MQRRLFLASSLVFPILALVARPRGARAAEHEVQMLNKGPDGQRNWFEPALIRVEPGDTVTFVPTDKGHNSASVVIPEGAEPWNGKLSQEIAVTFTVPGLYSYKCLPHFGLGMVGLIAVGDPAVNFDAVAAGKYPGKAKTVVSELLREVKATA
jgi:pseudoazurin